MLPSHDNVIVMSKNGKPGLPLMGPVQEDERGPLKGAPGAYADPRGTPTVLGLSQKAYQAKIEEMLGAMEHRVQDTQTQLDAIASRRGILPYILIGTAVVGVSALISLGIGYTMRPDAEDIVYSDGNTLAYVREEIRKRADDVDDKLNKSETEKTEIGTDRKAMYEALASFYGVEDTGDAEKLRLDVHSKMASQPLSDILGSGDYSGKITELERRMEGVSAAVGNYPNEARVRSIADEAIRTAIQEGSIRRFDDLDTLVRQLDMQVGLAIGNYQKADGELRNEGKGLYEHLRDELAVQRDGIVALEKALSDVEGVLNHEGIRVEIQLPSDAMFRAQSIRYRGTGEGATEEPEAADDSPANEPKKKSK